MAAALTNKVGSAFYGNFSKLRPAQQDAIEPVIAGHDVLVLAGTGSGKTEAVLAPLVQRWLPAMRKQVGCTIIYVTPTRALANDLLRRIEPPMEQLGLRVGVRHGERNDFGRAKKPDLLITTPESLDVLLSGRNPALQSVGTVVVDEIHLFYNTQRGFQLGVLLNRLEAFTNTSCQVVGLSATVATPADIWHFFRPGRDFVTVLDKQSKPLDTFIREVASDQALVRLIDSLSNGPRAKILLFANSRRECDQLGAILRGTTGFGENIFVHHSSLDGQMRVDTEQRFQQASKAVCIATSTLELGIDIGDIDLVALYGPPSGWESFLQRVGRGNRRSDKTNVACLVSPNHGPQFRSFLAFEALLSQIRSGSLERERPLDIYGAAAQQLLSLISEKNGGFQRILDLSGYFVGWPHLEYGVIKRILDGLAESEHLKRHGFKNQFGAGDELHRLRDRRMIWGNFPLRSRDLRLMSDSRQIGSFPETNLMRISVGTTIRFAGRHWRVRRIGADHIDVEPSRSTGGVEISYGGSAARMEPTIVEEMLRLIEVGIESPSMSEEATRTFVASADRMRPYVAKNRLPVAQDGERNYYYFTFGGHLLNEVLARWFELDDYETGEIVLRSNRRLDFSGVPTDLRALEDFAAQALEVPGDLTNFQILLPDNLLLRELGDIWLKTAVHERSLERLRNSQLTPAPLTDLAPLSDAKRRRDAG